MNVSMKVSALADLELKQLRVLVEQIGNTPVQAIYLELDGTPRAAFLKLEGANPGGSVKARTAYSLIRYLEEYKLLQRNSVILESTSGNLGVALAMIAKARGYHFRAITDLKATQENVAKMQLLDAEVEIISKHDRTGGYLLSRLERIEDLCRASSRYIWTNQYSNVANPAVHYKQTGPELYRQMNGNIDVVFVAVSTGGTLAGIGRYFREVSPQTRIIGVDVKGSVVFGTPPGPRILTGIGAARPSDFITRDVYDTYMLVGDEEAFAFCHALYDGTGIRVGGSSGAVLAACARYLAEHPEVKRPACLCPDTGENYVSSIFNQHWLEQHNLSLAGHLGSVTRILSEI